MGGPSKLLEVQRRKSKAPIFMQSGIFTILIYTIDDSVCIIVQYLLILVGP